MVTTREDLIRLQAHMDQETMFMRELFDKMGPGMKESLIGLIKDMQRSDHPLAEIVGRLADVGIYSVLVSGVVETK